MTLCDFCGRKMDEPRKTEVCATTHARVAVDMCLSCRCKLEKEVRQAEVDFYARERRNADKEQDDGK